MFYENTVLHIYLFRDSTSSEDVSSEVGGGDEEPKLPKSVQNDEEDSSMTKSGKKECISLMGYPPMTSTT